MSTPPSGASTLEPGLRMYERLRSRNRDQSPFVRLVQPEFLLGWLRLPNCLSPVSLSRCSGHAHTLNYRSPGGLYHRPVQAGPSWQWVAWSWWE